MSAAQDPVYEEIYARLAENFENELLADTNLYPEALGLFKEQHDILKQENGREIFRTRFLDLSPAERERYLRYGLVDTLVEQAAWRKTQIHNFENSEEGNPYKMDTFLKIVEQVAKNKLTQPGEDLTEEEVSLKSGQILQEIFGHIKLRLTATPHPTSDLDEHADKAEKSGVDLFRDLIEWGMKDGGNQNPIAALLDEKNTVAPVRKATTLDELWFLADYTLRYNNASAKVRRELDQKFEETFGVKPSPAFPPDFTDTLLQIVVNAWHAGDYDGKPNAEHWTLLVGVTMKSHLSVSHHMWRLLQADKMSGNEKGEIPYASLEDLRADLPHPNTIKDEELRRLYKVLYNIRKDLKKIYDEAEADWKEIHLNKTPEERVNKTPEERVDAYKKKEANFKSYKTSLSQIYDKRDIEGKIFKNNKGYHFYKGLRDQLRYLYRKKFKEIGAASLQLIKDCIADLNSNGLAFFKIEPRHNDAVHKQIFDNLFASKEFREYALSINAILPEDLILIDEKKKFSNLSMIEQNRIFSALETPFSSIEQRGVFQKFLFSTNTLPYDPATDKVDPNFDGNGYPKQNLGALQRMEVIKIFPLTIGNLFIAAESDESAMRRLGALLWAFDIKNLVPTPLVEHLNEMRETEAILTRNIENGAKDRAQLMKLQQVEARFKSTQLALMVARSDITRQFGPLSNILVYHQIQKDIREAIINGVPEFIKEGCGLSNERGGGDPMVMVRLIAQEIQQCQIDFEGTEYEKNIDDAMKAMAMFMSATVQGRALYKTEKELQQQMEAQIVEMGCIWMELSGDLAPGSYIKQKQPFSRELGDFLNQAVEDTMEEYADLRDAKGSDGKKVINRFAERIAEMEMLKYTNVGARPDARNAGQKSLTDQRAIGNNKALALTETHLDGWFTVGSILEKLHGAAHFGNINEHDVEDFKNSEYWEYCLFTRSHMAAARADFGHMFRELEMEGWSHKQLIAIGKTARSTSKAVGTDDSFFSYDKESGATEEQAYAAMLYYDAQKMMALTHALLDGSFTQEYDLDKLLEKNHMSEAPDLKMNFNDAAKERYPHIQAVQDLNERARPAIEVVHIMNAELKKNPEAFSKEECYAAASWWTKSGESQVREMNYFPYSLGFGKIKGFFADLKDLFRFEKPVEAHEPYDYELN